MLCCELTRKCQWWVTTAPTVAHSVAVGGDVSVQKQLACVNELTEAECCFIIQPWVALAYLEDRRVVIRQAIEGGPCALAGRLAHD